MNCPRCQREAPADAAFCPKCGSNLSVACPQCGTATAPDDHFCRKCGQRLAVAATPVTVGLVSPASYTPKHLAEKILNSKAALEGERKQVTVLFADLKGSMELLADRDAEEARKILDPVLERMMEAVHRYEGTVNQVMGDGIMALFGAPIAHEDHAVRAGYAALRMQEERKSKAGEGGGAHGVNVQIRVCLNSGEVVVRAIGSDLHMDYTAVGQTTHLAARMEQLADPGAIVITPNTLALVEGFVEAKSLGRVALKGVAEPVQVHEILGASTVRSRFQAATVRGLTKFVGRALEMEQLGRALDQARTGRGQVIAVVGEPGVGKSRLYYEFLHSHRVQDCLVVQSASVSYGKAAAYLPVIDFLRAYFGVDGRDDARAIREKVTGRLLTLDRALEPFLLAFLWLLNVSEDDPTWEHLDPSMRRQRTLDGVKRVVIRESQVQPVVILFEDLHWIDSETQALLDALVEILPTARVLMLVNYRPEFQHTWGSKTYYRLLRIDPLPATNAHELLDALLGDDVTVQSLKVLLVQRTEGTPLFLEESVRALSETSVLVGERGSYHLARPIDTLEVPGTVKAVLAARIDRLAPDVKALLQAASVIGTDVPFALLEAIAEMPEHELQRGLGHLQAAEFLYETNLFPELEHTFKHALTHEVAYGSLLGDRRRRLHARIVEAIEQLYGDRVTEQVERLAHHAIRGELWDKAISYLHLAGTKAFMRSANSEAIACFRQAIDLVRRFPSSPELMRRNLRLLLALGPALQTVQGFGAVDVERTYSRARALCDQVGEPTELFQVLWGLWNHTGPGRGRFDAAHPIAEELLAVAERLSDRALMLEARHALGPTTLYLGQPVAARKHGEEGMALYDREQHRSLTFLYGGHDPGVCCRMHSGLALWILGHPTAALERSRGGLALARDLSHPPSVADALRILGTVYQLRGEVEATRELAESLIALSTEHGFQFWLAFGRILQSWALTEWEGGHTALLRLQGAITDYRSAGNELHVPYFLSLLAAAHLKHGATEEASAVVADALGRSEQIWDAKLYRIKGELVLVRDPGAELEAEMAFRQAIDIARRQGAKSWELGAVTSLSRLLLQQNKRDEAQSALAEIYGCFTEGLDTADLRDAKRLLDQLSNAKP